MESEIPTNSWEGALSIILYNVHKFLLVYTYCIVYKVNKTWLLVSHSDFWKFDAGGKLLFISFQMHNLHPKCDYEVITLLQITLLL